MSVYSPVIEFLDDRVMFPGSQDSPVRLPTRGAIYEEADLGGTGALTIRLPRPPVPATQYRGIQGRTIFDDYYNTIHVSPVAIDVGDVTNEVVRSVEVWNSFIESSQTIESVDAQQAEGIRLGGQTLPVTLGPLRATTFQVSVTSAGPADINAYFGLDLPGFDEARYWTIVGRRIIEWTVPPNWRDPYQVTYEFKTEVIVSTTGKEQRIALRHRPRINYAFTPMLYGAQGRQADRLLSTWQNRSFAMADWSQGVHTPGLPAGGQVLTVDEIRPSMKPGELITLRDSDGSQVIEISEIDGLTISLTSPVARSFSASTKVFPALIVRSESSVQVNKYTSAVGTLAARFLRTHKSGRLETTEAPHTYRETELFLTRPNWSGQATLEHSFEYDERDTGRGYFDAVVTHLAPKDVRKAVYTFYSRSEVDAFLEFFYRCKGRRGEFYAPTWDDNVAVDPNRMLVNGSGQLPLAESGDVGRFVNDRVYRNLTVRLADGELMHRQISYAEEGTDGPVIVVTEPWPRTMSPGEIVSVSWLPRWRLGSDEVSIEWLTDGRAQATLSMQTIEDVDE